MRRISTRTLLVVGLLVCLLLAGVVSGVASSQPDGLEHVAKELGFAGSADEHARSGSPLAGYETTGVEDSRVGGGVAGIAGVALVGALMWGLLRVLRRPRREAARDRADVDRDGADDTGRR